MLSVYKDVLSIPGARAFSGAGLLARLPMSMLGIGIVILLGGGHGGYGLAGAVAATFGLSQAVMGPLLSRLVDLHGQKVILRPAVVLHAVGVCTLTATALLEGPTYLLFAGAVLGGASMLSMGSLVRARWADNVPQGPSLQAAFSLEAVLDELLFVAGPVLVTFLAAILFPAAGLVVAVVAGTIGGLVFSCLWLTEPLPHVPLPRSQSTKQRPILLIPSVSLVVATFLLVGVVFGANDVVAVAFASQAGSPSMAGVVLAMLAVGSFTSGLLYGARHWKMSRLRQLVCGFLLFAVGTAILPWAPTLPLVGLSMLITGIAVGPLMIVGSSIIQASVPSSRLTEGLTWMSTSLGLGVSLGAAGGGSAVDIVGPQYAFVISTTAGIAALLIALVASVLFGPRLALLESIPQQSAHGASSPTMEVPLPMGVSSGGVYGGLLLPGTQVTQDNHDLAQEVFTDYWPASLESRR